MMIYKDKSKSVAERVENLLSLMTTEEKAGQLVQPFGWQTYTQDQGNITLNETFKRQVEKGGVGSLYGTLRADPWTGVTLENGLSAKAGAEVVNLIQRYAVDHSRLGIPILIGEECSHGHMAIDGTVYPVPLLLGSTWNVELYQDMCRAVALETRAQGGVVTYSPVLDVVRDPRWGRTEECFGEGTIDLRTGASNVSEYSWNDMECGEGIDRMTLGLAGVQLELMQEIYKLGKTMIVVYINGRPIAEPWVDEHADAILEAWYPGQEGGHAIADLLFGDVNPSGRLTISIPKHVGQLPVYYNGKRSRGKRYLEEDLEPRYVFGYGLSYTTFEYSKPKLTRTSMTSIEHVTLTVEITNTGQRSGAEVVQLYIADIVSQMTRPAKELKAFSKIRLEPGETRTVAFQIGAEQLQYIGRDLKPVVEPGQFHLHVGRNVNDTQWIELTVEEA